jgi:acetylornithine deacetylase
VEAVSGRLGSTLPDSASLEVISASEPLRLSTVEGFERTVVSFGSDAPYLRALGDVLMIGPGSIRHAHREDEQVRVEELEQAARDYERLVRTLNRKWDLEAG